VVVVSLKKTAVPLARSDVVTIAVAVLVLAATVGGMCGRRARTGGPG